MKLVKFKVENYRNINDSGCIEVNDIACIVGKNESGKTSLLQALWKFNPFKKIPYSLDREWPRGRRRERSDDATVCTCWFAFDQEEQKTLSEIDSCFDGIKEVIISKDYGGKRRYKFVSVDFPSDFSWVVSTLKKHLGTLPDQASDYMKQNYQKAFEQFLENIPEDDPGSYVISVLNDFLVEIEGSPDAAEQDTDQEVFEILEEKEVVVNSKLEQQSPRRNAIETVRQWLPTFIYMDDYRVFSGRAQLNQVQSRVNEGTPKDDDETIIMIMNQAGLNLDEEVQKGNEEDREQRMLDMNDASHTLTNEISDRWSQKKYEVMFQADGQHFITFVKDEGGALIPLEERSKGFQWFFSFDMTFMCETEGSFENAIILLDEPGLHLHASAQRDLLERMYAYADKNQLIYTTHLPFMVDSKRLDNIHICEELPEGTKVHQNWQTANKDARFTLQAALGLSWSQSLFVGQHNLVVEGVTDFWYLSAFSSLFDDAGEVGLPEELVITPAGGASKVAYVGTVLQGQELNVCVLLDSDDEGKNAYEQLVHQWILDEKLALKLGTILSKSRDVAIEDLFSTDYYLKFVNQAYSKELSKKSLQLKEEKKTIVDRVVAALKKENIRKFNKGRVAKMILRDITSKSLSDFDDSTVDSFRKVISAINEIYMKWTE